MPNGGSPVSGGPDSAPIHVRTRYERFPAAIKGAFVMRGADGNPHSVRLGWARVARFPSGPVFPFPAEDRILDANPIRDLFVPFEAPVLDLEPGWYVIESSVQVDGGRAWPFSSRPFSIPWPRGEVRRGSITLGKAATAGNQRFGLERVELNASWAAVIWRPVSGGARTPQPDTGSARNGEAGDALGVLIADGEELEMVSDDAVGIPQLRSAVERRTVSYPVRRSVAALAVVMRLASGEDSGPIAVSLD